MMNTTDSEWTHSPSSTAENLLTSYTLIRIPPRLIDPIFKYCCSMYTYMYIIIIVVLSFQCVQLLLLLHYYYFHYCCLCRCVLKTNFPCARRLVAKNRPCPRRGRDYRPGARGRRCCWRSTRWCHSRSVGTINTRIASNTRTGRTSRNIDWS